MRAASKALPSHPAPPVRRLHDRVVPIALEVLEGSMSREACTGHTGQVMGQLETGGPSISLVDDLNEDARLYPLLGRVPVQRLDFRCPAGFPSPAADFQVDRVNLPDLLELDRPHVFMARVSGYSMRDKGISDGDLLVINRKTKPLHGSIVVAVVDNEFTCKVLYRRSGLVKLLAANPDYPDIVPREAQEIQIWGVVTSCIKRF